MNLSNLHRFSAALVVAGFCVGCNTDPTPNPKIIDQMNAQRKTQAAGRMPKDGSGFKPGMASPYGNSPKTAPTTTP